MSKHAMRGGNVAGLLERFAQLREKARMRTGKSSSSRRQASTASGSTRFSGGRDRKPRRRSGLDHKFASAPKSKNR
jgi:hypothetical protein